jgi:hypothetical protein
MLWVMVVLLAVETPGAPLATLALRLLLLVKSLHGAAVMVVVDGRRHMQTSSLSFAIQRPSSYADET